MSSHQERATLRNPVAPLPKECEQIYRLIERDESLVKILTKEKEERESIIEQNESKEAIGANCLSAINADLARATQLRSILTEALRNVETFDGSLGTKAPSSHRTHDVDHLPNLSDSMPVSRIATNHHSATTECLLEVEGAIGKATSTASHLRQEVRATKSLISMTQDDISSIEDQIHKRMAAILVKKFGLKAIWRIPDEVWGLIFQHSTGTITTFIDLNDDWVRGNTSWHAALVISGVCQRWRYIAIAVSRIWANITIFRGAWRVHDLSRVKCYIERAGDSPKTLLLGGTIKVSDNQLKDVRTVLGKCGSVNRIICRLVRSHLNFGLASVLDCLPLAPEVWLRDEPHTGPSLDFNPGHYISIPYSLSMEVKRLVTESIRVYWGSPDPSDWRFRSQEYPRLHSCSIISPSVYVGLDIGLFFNLSIGQFLATSLPTLKDLRLCTPRYSREVVVHVAETALETLHVDLQCLLVNFAPRFTMPSLRNLVITGGSDATAADYELSEARMLLGSLQSLTIESTTSLEPLSALILDSLSLTSLELRGDSVDVILSSLVKDYHDEKKPFLSSLRRLVIDSYGGVGGSVYDFLRAWKSSHAPSLRPLGFILFADECPSVTLETRKKRCSLAGGIAAA